MSTWVVIVAAGSGRRFGGAKQFADLAGVPVLGYAVSTAAAVADGVVVVLPEDVANRPVPGADTVVPGGATRSESVRAGLGAVPDSAEVILVHDAARPLSGTELFRRVVAAVSAGADAAIPVVPVADTIRSVDGGVVDRDRLRAVQTPQGFRAAALRAAHADGAEATDDATLVEAAGGTVVLVDGHRRNLKLTEAEDLLVAAAFLAFSTDVPTSVPPGGSG